MKRLIINLIFVSIISLLLNSTTFGTKLSNDDEPEKNGYNNYANLTDEEYDQVEQNLLAGIKSDNIGLQTSSAYYLGELKSGKSLIQLLKLARYGNTEESRIIAGLSLYKIESDIGMYLLKGLRQSDDSEKVRRSFDRIYKKYISDNRSFKYEKS
ncbi:MAG: hypothetical protein IH795_07930 [Bacteroidetes bacterium]|nr:hypothetical protein [Bacteroidota bacterium]